MTNLLRIAKFMGFFVVIILVLLIVALVLATLTDYQPSDREQMTPDGNTESTHVSKNEISLLTWNIGYGGLGSEMDFFYEGGKQVRPTIAKSEQYLRGIQNFISSHNQTDFILLQEVDKKARRSHWKNQVEFLAKMLTYHNWVFAKNYDVPFVPIPVNQPMGRVTGGLVNFSKYCPITSVRVPFPGDLGWPQSLFLLDRCYLIQRFVTLNEKVLVVINTHNSAFDNGEKRKQQLDLLKLEALTEYQKGNYVVIGGDWNLNPPDFDMNEINNGDCASFNSAGSIQSDFFPTGWKWAYDENIPTNRQVDQPYQQGQTPATTLDFFLLSPNVELLEVNAFDLKFENSDHNPVRILIRLF